MGENFEVLAVHNVNFKDKNTGEQVTGTKLFVSQPCHERGWHGDAVSSFWFPAGSDLEDLVNTLKRGNIIYIAYNRFGKPAAINVQ